MKIFSLLAAVLSLGLWLTMVDAEAAKRVGGGASSGMQRNMSAPGRAPDAAPAQAPTTPSAAAAPLQAPSKRSWMGPVAGLAAGLGLAALASYLGFGEEFASMMMIALLVMVVLAVVGFIMRRRAAAQQPAMAGAGGMPYVASGAPPPSYAGGSIPGSGPNTVPGDARSSGAAPLFNARIPADFDVAGFVHQAKVNFVRLQAANDAGNLDDLREFTTPEMFAELKTSLLGRGSAAQQTDVVEINAEVLEVVEEASRDVVTVRYRGLIREDRGLAESFDEVWHLVKPRDSEGGWRLAGIQQMS